MMQLRIAVKFGILPSELKCKLSESDFRLLWLYYQLEPWGSEIVQLTSGIVAATVANCRQGRKRGDKTMVAYDFMPTYQRVEKVNRRHQTQEEMQSVMTMLAKRKKRANLTEDIENECN